MLPKPGLDWTPVLTRYWLRSASAPAKKGAPAEVPPAFSRSPLYMTAYASCFHDAVSEMSGTWRALSSGTPGPVCHAGLVHSTLAPPPEAARPFTRVVLSFQAISG